MQQKDYYDILGVDSQAPLSDIRRSYRTLARKYHPDASSDQDTIEKFRQIQEAWGVLRDEDKRAEYDRFYVATRIHQNGKSSEDDTTDPGERLRNTFQANAHLSGDDATGLNSHKFTQKPKSNSLFGSFFGAKEKPQKKRRPPNTTSGRHAAFKDSATVYHSDDDGRGERIYQYTIDALESLTGTIREIALLEEGETRITKVQIPPGVVSGEVFKTTCPVAKGKPVRRVRVQAHIEPHKYFLREGLDVVMKVPLTVGEAISGIELDLPYVGGTIRIKIPPQAEEGTRLRLKGKGIKSRVKNEVGDLYIRPFVSLPKHLDDRLEKAGRLLDELYTGDVRANLPEKIKAE